jgi:hypothetical protein
VLLTATARLLITPVPVLVIVIFCSGEVPGGIRPKSIFPSGSRLMVYVLASTSNVTPNDCVTSALLTVTVAEYVPVLIRLQA